MAVCTFWVALSAIVSACSGSDALQAPPVAPPVARAPLSFGPAYLTDMSSRCLDNLFDVDGGLGLLADLYSYMSEEAVVKWGSGCSGTDSPAWSLRGILECLNRRGISVSSDHIVSAEIRPEKRRWISTLCSPRVLLGDVFDMSRSVACCADTKTRYIRPPSACAGMHQALFGFSCKSVSNLNSYQCLLASSAVFDMNTQTGATLRGTLLALQRLGPSSAILENVKGLDRGGQIEAVSSIALHHPSIPVRHTTVCFQGPLRQSFVCCASADTSVSQCC